MSEAELETRERILLAAKEEFLEKGYKNAWLRNISKKAGVTTGALYGYFKNKEDLFGTLVEKEYHYVLHMYNEVLQEFNTVPPAERIDRTSEYTGKGMRLTGTYMYEHWDAFKLILCHADDTAYGHLIDDMVELDIQATIAFSQSSEAVGIMLRPVNETLAQRLSYSKFSLFFDMVTQELPREQMDEYIDQLLQFYLGGWEKLWGY